jgi:hypothetical protein
MTKTERIRHMSTKELALFGMQDIAYIKRAVGTGELGYTVHAADGTQIAVFPNREVALVTMRQYDLDPLSVH